MKNDHIPTFKENVDAFVLKASKALKISDDLINHIRSTHSVLQVNVGIKIKNQIGQNTVNTTLINQSFGSSCLTG